MKVHEASGYWITRLSKVLEFWQLFFPSIEFVNSVTFRVLWIFLLKNNIPFAFVCLHADYPTVRVLSLTFVFQEKLSVRKYSKHLRLEVQLKKEDN